MPTTDDLLLERQICFPLYAASRLLTEIDLWEISLVTFPMLPGARVSFVSTSERTVR